MIWAFFSRRIRLWLLLAVGVPLIRRLLGAAGDTIETRTGRPTPVTRGLKGASTHLTRYERRSRRQAS